MNNIKWYIGSSCLSAILLFGVSSLTSTISADEPEHEREEHEHENKGHSKRQMTTKNYALYKTECGSCHIAYPAALLPKKSWDKLMNNLDDHFDENAELDKGDRLKIQTYLAQNSSNRYRGKVPLRITKSSYFIRKHDEIPRRMVTGNPKVKSFSQCDKCHSGAESGDFEEDRVKIPGFGRWED